MDISHLQSLLSEYSQNKQSQKKKRKKMGSCCYFFVVGTMFICTIIHHALFLLKKEKIPKKGMTRELCCFTEGILDFWYKRILDAFEIINYNGIVV